VPLLLLASALSFVLLSLASGNPAAEILGPTASAAQLHQLTVQLGLDQPIRVQYWHWLDAALHAIAALQPSFPHEIRGLP
jgi:peptide/nickel transport system permease protein